MNHSKQELSRHSSSIEGIYLGDDEDDPGEVDGLDATLKVCGVLLESQPLDVLEELCLGTYPPPPQIP